MSLITRFLVVATLLTLLVGCTRAETPKEPPTVKFADYTPDATALASLARADSIDGTEDEVVGNCFMCELGMAGDASITSTLGPYTLHHCSTECRDLFDRDPGRWIAAAVIPEG